MKRFIQWGALLLMGLLIGLFIGRSMRPAMDQAASGIKTTGTPIHRSQDFSSAMSSHSVLTEQPINELFERITVDDFERLANNALRSEDPIKSHAMLSLLISGWADKDPMGALAFAAERELSDLLYLPLLALGESDPEQALAWVDNYSDNDAERMRLVRYIYQGLARVAPEQAMGYVEQLPEGRGKDNALTAVVEEWAQRDMKGAFDWIETANFTAPVRNVYTSLMYEYMAKDPVAAADVVLHMNACELKREFASRAATDYAKTDLAGALQWADGLDPESKRAALPGIMDTWASGSDPGGALNYVLDNQSGDHDERLLEVVASSLAYSSPDLLMNSMETMPASDQLIVAKRLAVALCSTDLKQCDDWLQDLPTGTLRDTVLHQVLDDYRNSNPSRAFSLSETIAQDGTRQKAMERMISEWVLVDQVAAEQALNQSSALSFQQKKEMLARIHRTLPQNDYLIP